MPIKTKNWQKSDAESNNKDQHRNLCKTQTIFSGYYMPFSLPTIFLFFTTCTIVLELISILCHMHLPLICNLILVPITITSNKYNSIIQIVKLTYISSRLWHPLSWCWMGLFHLKGLCSKVVGFHGYIFMFTSIVHLLTCVYWYVVKLLVMILYSLYLTYTKKKKSKLSVFVLTVICLSLVIITLKFF